MTSKKTEVSQITPWEDTHLYISGENNHKCALDCTQIGVNGWLLLIIDLCSRCMIGHYHIRVKHSADSVITLLNRVIMETDFILSSVNIFLLDNGTEFKNHKVQALCNKHNITLVFTDPGQFQNQVVESCNNSIKNGLRVLINENYRVKTEGKKQLLDPLRKVFSDKIIGPKIKLAIENYNAAESTLYKGVSKNTVQDAMHEKKMEPGSIILAKNNNSVNAVKIKNFVEKNIVIEINKKKSFLTQYEEQSLRLNFETFSETKRISAKLEKLTNLLNDKEVEIVLREKKYESDLEKSLSILRELQETNRNKDLLEKKKLEAKENYKNRSKKPIRMIITQEEFQLLLKIIENKDAYVFSRKICAFYLLYVTGFRISQLLELKVSELKQLLESGMIVISQIKGGDKRFSVVLATTQRNFLKEANEYFDIILEGKQDGDFAFSSKVDSQKALNRCNFNSEINKDLKTLSKKVGKNILSHSFRVTTINELLENDISIDTVQKFIGHKNINTTLNYDRRRLTNEEIKKISSVRTHTTRKKKLVKDFEQEKKEE